MRRLSASPSLFFLCDMLKISRSSLCRRREHSRVDIHRMLPGVQRSRLSPCRSALQVLTDGMAKDVANFGFDALNRRIMLSEGSCQLSIGSPALKPASELAAILDPRPRTQVRSAFCHSLPDNQFALPERLSSPSSHPPCTQASEFPLRQRGDYSVFSMPLLHLPPRVPATSQRSHNVQKRIAFPGRLIFVCSDWGLSGPAIFLPDFYFAFPIIPGSVLRRGPRPALTFL